MQKESKQGIYLLANDAVGEQTIALLNSIRHFDSETPIIIIPFNNQTSRLAKIITNFNGVSFFEDRVFLEKFSAKLDASFGKGFFDKPNKHLKYAAWFGPFEEFIYIDTDIVVFERIRDMLEILKENDFFHWDFEFKNGFKNIFTQKIIDGNVFSKDDVSKVFNSGFWGSKKSLLNEELLYQTFEEAGRHKDYFDFSGKVTDQPILNYVILKHCSHKLNFAHVPEKIAGNWAGSPHFQRENNRLKDPNSSNFLPFVHWAGIRIEPGCPYWDIWKHYRELNPSIPYPYSG